MSRFGETLPLYAAQAAARELRTLLQGVCVRIEIAGSIRREAPTVGDIELVAIPTIEERRAPGQLFDDVVAVDLLDRALTYLVAAADGSGDDQVAPLARFGRAPAFGPRHKQFAFHHGRRWFPVDLFSVTRETWGCQFAIRTGDAEFARLLVTQRCHGGALPAEWKWTGGRLFDAAARVIETPEETDVFRALGLPAWEPRLRSAGRLREFLQQGSDDAHVDAQGRRSGSDRGYASVRRDQWRQGQAAH